jgi:hypothetical protein
VVLLPIASRPFVFACLTSRSGGLGYHLDGMTRALLEANGTACALGVVVFVKLSRPELNDCILGTGGKAIVAFEAIAA